MHVADVPPFTWTGVDFAGPLYFPSSRDPQSNEKISEKVLICLFTCASTRAVNLELTRDLGVNSFLQAFRWFSSRRGLPSTLISDNAETFKASSKEIEKLFKSQEFQRYLSNNRVSWRFIVEKAPWGGVLGGGVLGETYSKREKKHQENSGRGNISRLRWTEHSGGGSRKSHQFTTSHIHLRWWGVYFTPYDSVPFGQWSRDKCDAKWRALRNNKHPQYSNKTTTTSQASIVTVPLKLSLTLSIYLQSIPETG